MTQNEEHPLAQQLVEKVWQEDGIVWLWLNRPTTRNALNDQLVKELIDNLTELAVDMQSRVLVISGRGGSFCSGGDVAALENLQHQSPINRMESYRTMQRLILALIQHPLPIIAAVDGPAVGAGCDLALAADVVFASPNATFGETFVQAGLVPDFGGSYLLPQIVGWHRALDMLLTGQRIDAQTAQNIGIVRAVTPDLPASVQQWAEQICRRSRETVKYLKAMAWHNRLPSLVEELSRASMMQSLMMDTEGHRAFVRNFLGKG
jgi:2-(1,2-epoxy-1,2-dihydrophenyl)acetyl-CoA isomerase